MKPDTCNYVRQDKYEVGDWVQPTRMSHIYNLYNIVADANKQNSKPSKWRNTMRKLSKTIRKMLKPNEVAILEAFTVEPCNNIVWDEYLSRWFIEEFGKNENLLKVAKEKAADYKKCCEEE